MNLAYIAAEYFVEAISISPSFHVSFEYVKILRNLISKEIGPQISEYLNKKSQRDPLYIFRKFPDIFVIKNNYISLTEVFLSLFSLKRPSAISKRYHYLNSYVENCAIVYFINILLTQGPRPYLFLFSVLMNDQTQTYTKYFRHFSEADVLKFFLVHSNYFLILNNVVYLNKKQPLQPYTILNNQIDTEAIKIFEISVYFLLTCFDSLHYLELKQCLSYVQESTKHILEQISLVRQRELFQSLPVVFMDEFGYLSTKCKELLIALPDLMKSVLLIVTILAFNREMHITDLAVAFSSKMSSSPISQSFSSQASLTEQIDFIKSYPAYFCISNYEYISLLPRFVLPVIHFPDYENNALTYDENINDLNISTDNTSDSTATNLCNVNDKNHVEHVQDVKSLSTSANSLCISRISKTVNERIRQSFLILVNYFYPLDNKRVLQTLLHAMDDVRLSFCSLSETHKHKFIAVCCDFIETLSNECLQNTIDSLITEKEEIVLFITYMLTANKKIHFMKFLEFMNDFKMDNILLKSAISDQYKYFKALKEYVSIVSDGSVVLSPSFHSIKSLIKFYCGSFSNSESCTENVENVKSSIHFEDESGKLSKTLTWVSSVVPLETRSSTQTSPDKDKSSATNNSVELPANVYKMLSYCAKLIRKYDEFAATIHILKATFFSLIDIYNYLRSLSDSVRYEFVSQCFKFLNKETVYTSSAKIKENEKQILFITYLLRDHAIHYRKIIIELNKCSCTSLSSLSDRSQFKYFKEKEDLFVIGGNGYVELSSFYNAVDFIVNEALSQRVKSQDVSKCSSVTSKNLNLPAEEDMVATIGCEKNIISTEKHEKIGVFQSNPKSSHIDTDSRDTVIDFVYFLLSRCERMSVEKLCYRINTCNLKEIHNMFSSYTVTEKLNFFKNLSPHFEVSKDGFVSLKKNSNEAFAQTTKLNVSELFEKKNSASEKSFNTPRSRSESDSIKSTSDVSESLSSNSNNSVHKRRRRRIRNRRNSSKNENLKNKISYETRKITYETHVSNTDVSNTNSNFEVQIKCVAKTTLKTFPSNSALNESNCNTIKDLKKNTETQSKAAAGLSYKDTCLNVDQMSKNFDKKNDVVKSASKNAGNLLEKSKIFSSSVPENIHKLKMPRQPQKASIFSGLQKSNLTSLESTSTESKLNKTVEWSRSKCAEIPISSNDCLLNTNSNLSNSSGCEVVSSFEEIDKALQTISMSSSLWSSFNDLTKDSSYQAYISDLIDDFLYSAKTKSSDPETSKSKNVIDNAHSYSDKNYDSKSDSFSKQISKNKPLDDDDDDDWGEILESDIDSSSNSTFKLKNEPQTLPMCTKVSKAASSLVPGEKMCDKISEAAISKEPEHLITPRHLNSREVSVSETSTEVKAVNFFTILLRNYKHHEESISTDFLKKHIKQASIEVQSFMYKHYRFDFLPFFQKHKRVFYVSPHTRCVYLVQKI